MRMKALCASSSPLQAFLRIWAQRTQLTPSVVLKVGMVGDAGIGKTSLMVKYVEGSFECVTQMADGHADKQRGLHPNTWGQLHGKGYHHP